MSPESFDSENGLPEHGNSESSSQFSDHKVAYTKFISFFYPFVFTIADSKIDPFVYTNCQPLFHTVA